MNAYRLSDASARVERFINEHIDSLPIVKKTTQKEILQELRVHQIELEMQNEILLLSRSELEKIRDQYADLYDYAPVGYVTSTPSALFQEPIIQ